MVVHDGSRRQDIPAWTEFCRQDRCAVYDKRRLGRVIKDMKAACPGADFACDMQVKFDSNGGDRLETPKSKINAWAQSVKALL